MAKPSALVDRIAAVVDETPILLSDIERVSAFGLVARQNEESEFAYRQRVLDGLIDRHLRLRDARRYEREPIDSQVTHRQIAAIRNRFADPAAFAASLDALGMTESSLEMMIADQLRVLRHVETRLRARVFVSNEAIQQHYDDAVLAQATATDKPPPPLDELRDAIRALLTEQLLDQEISRWTQELRERADIAILLRQEERPLPPLSEVRTPE
jgi:hypothetical protein